MNKEREKKTARNYQNVTVNRSKHSQGKPVFISIYKDFIHKFFNMHQYNMQPFYENKFTFYGLLK